MAYWRYQILVLTWFNVWSLWHCENRFSKVLLKSLPNINRMVPQFRDDVILIKARQYTVPVHTLLHYPGYQRLFMRGFRFLSLKKWPARKAPLISASVGSDPWPAIFVVVPCVLSMHALKESFSGYRCPCRGRLSPGSVDRGAGEPKLYLITGTVARKINILRLENWNPYFRIFFLIEQEIQKQTLRLNFLMKIHPSRGSELIRGAPVNLVPRSGYEITPQCYKGPSLAETLLKAKPLNARHTARGWARSLEHLDQ